MTEIVENHTIHFYCDRCLLYATMMANLGSSGFQTASDFYIF